MDRGRHLPIATALLAVLVLAVVASVLETTPIASPYEVPVEGEADGGGSLVSVLYALVVALLGLLGIELEEPVGPVGSPLAALLEAVLPHLPSLAALLVAGVVVGTLGVAARRLPVSGLVPDHLPDRGWRAETAAETTDGEWPPAEPDPGVADAWLEMTAAVDPDRPAAALTPAEWAEAAADRGLDDDAVADLTRLFRETRYGGADETPEDRRRARRDVGNLEGDPE